jgi:glycosyltransferase involved in cell wall biosynthesis
MKISVIIPALNEEARIGTAIEALLTQTQPPAEIIVVDNGCTDGTSAAASRFPVKVVREERKGTMWACERGRRAASGDIIVRMDADCMPEKDWLANGTTHFINAENVIMVSGPYDYADGSRFFRKSALLTQRYLFGPVHALLQLFKAGGVSMGGNTFIRSSTLEKAGGFNTDIEFYGDDTELPKRLARFGRIIFDRRLVMKTSARRFQEEGVFRLQMRYIFHFFKQLSS